MFKDFALSLLSAGGAFRFGEMLRSRNLLVLTYHRVIPRDGFTSGKRPPNTHFADEFDEQMAFIARRFNVLTGKELRAFIEGAVAIPRYSLAITFDDGYENNFTHALPILQRHGLHAAFFITTNLIGHSDRSLWFDRLDRLRAAVPGDGIREQICKLYPDVPPDLPIQRYFKTLSSERQLRLLNALERHFADAGIPLAERVVHGMMSWDQVRSLVAAGMTVGSHTANHQILAAVPPAEARQELRSSRLRIEEETSAPCWCFAYPNGERRDFRSVDERSAEDAGYLCAFTQVPGSIGRRAPRYALPRIPIPDSGDMNVFRSYISGVQRALRAVVQYERRY